MRIILTAMAVLLTAGIAVSAGAASLMETALAVLPAGPGQRQVATACGSCHAIAIVTGKHYSPQKWGDTVDRMTDRGAKVSDADYDLVIAYLSANFGPAIK